MSFTGSHSRNLIVLVLLAVGAVPPLTTAKELSPSGQLDLVQSGYYPTVGLITFECHGHLRHLGKCTATGQALFAWTGEPGVVRGVGVAVFVSANGDQIVGLLDWVIGPDTLGICDVHWVVEAELIDGTVVESTGRLRNPAFGDFRFATGLTPGDVPGGWWMNLNR
jgi:hypothetical protein